MYPSEHIQLNQSRRTFLRRTSSGIGTLALGALLKPSLLHAAQDNQIQVPSLDRCPEATARTRKVQASNSTYAWPGARPIWKRWTTSPS